MTSGHAPRPLDVARLDLWSIDSLRLIMAALRAPETGCPWDLAQTFETIAPYTIEEAYEVADAIARNDLGELKDELGDLLLQVVYHSQMAHEVGAFALGEVVEAICSKMIRRHPHVFGSVREATAGRAKSRWEDAKAEERGETRGEGSELDGIPAALPSLTRAIKLQARAARVGFDWPSTDEVVEKIAEESAELRSAPEAARAEELGDLLFALANLARHHGIDAEAALRQANAKFERRFAYIETSLRSRGRTPSQSSLAEMDALWNEAKKTERKD